MNTRTVLDEALSCYDRHPRSTHHQRMLAALNILGIDGDMPVDRLRGLVSPAGQAVINAAPTVDEPEHDESVTNVIARSIGYTPPTDGVLGSGTSMQMAFMQATAICRALGVSPHLSAHKLRRWGSGAVTHLGPDDVFESPGVAALRAAPTTTDAELGDQFAADWYIPVDDEPVRGPSCTGTPT